MIDWNKLTKYELTLILAIVERAENDGILEKLGGTPMDLIMDIEATHVSGCPLRLAELAKAQAYDFAHDIAGIRRHINRTTGQLEDCFLPRYAVTN